MKNLLLSIIVLQGTTMLAMENDLPCYKLVDGQKVAFTSEEKEFLNTYSEFYSEMEIDYVEHELKEFPDFCTWRFCNGDTCLHLLMRGLTKRPDLLQFLLDQGADPHVKNNDGHTVFDLVEGKDSFYCPTPQENYMAAVLAKYETDPAASERLLETPDEELDELDIKTEDSWFTLENAVLTTLAAVAVKLLYNHFAGKSKANSA